MAVNTLKILTELGWEILTHPPYSPDIVPSDDHVFPSLQSHPNGKELKSFDGVKTCTEASFESKSAAFYAFGINKLKEGRSTAINNNGSYTVD